MHSMSSHSHLEFSDAFGFHKENRFLSMVEGFDHERENTKIVRSWIPILGTIAAIYKLRAFSNPNAAIHEYSKGYQRGYTIRTCIELFSLGFLLIIPDLIVTSYKAQQERSERNDAERDAREFVRIYGGRGGDEFARTILGY